VPGREHAGRELELKLELELAVVLCVSVDWLELEVKVLGEDVGAGIGPKQHVSLVEPKFCC